MFSPLRKGNELLTCNDAVQRVSQRDRGRKINVNDYKEILTRTQVSNESHHNSAIATKNVKGVTIRSQMN